MSIMFEIQEHISAIEELIDRMESARAERFGLDSRAAYRLSYDLDDRVIACPVRDDRTLQYYGGFEYEVEARMEVGEWVLYLGDLSDRVAECLNFLEESIEEREPEMA